ncbi:MAG: N-acylneuraminate-9-phosphate synthase [Lachnospiraceae bacterium]|nr:N-acylneuraminate-9-phosphate synthase [Lachnospiraceae bacterium]
MAILTLRNGLQIGSGFAPYIVAEFNSSHNGNVETAKRMIDAAKECGCDCVKMQSWSAESLYAEEYYKSNPIAKRMVAKFSLAEEKLKELALYCRDCGMDFSSTPYSKEEVDFLAEQVKVPFLKIASMEIDNLPFLQYISSKGLPMVLSTGMSTMDEIRTAVKAIESAGNDQLCILHCVSMYPAEPPAIHLNNMKLLQEEFPDYPVGYSDHAIGYEVAAASVALGAAYIEKHFTLDSKKMGMDNNMAAEPEDMRALVTACHNVYVALGKKQRKLFRGEWEQRLKMRRSLVAARDIAQGEILTAADIDVKRPGDGIRPTELDSVVGETAKRDIPKGYLIRREYLESALDS